MRAPPRWCLLAVGASLWAASGAAAQETPGSADVLVVVDGPGSARVEARYQVAPAPTPLAFRALAAPCTEIRDPRLERSGQGVELTAEREGPWLVLRDTTRVGTGDALRGTVRYEVRTTGTLDRVPLPVLEVPVPQMDGEREGTVRVEVRVPDPEERVVFPHMTHDGPSWSARYVAVPSFVGVAGVHRDGTACAPTSPVPPDGGLVWRFWLLVGIMAAWVPLYLAWARRTDGEDA